MISPYPNIILVALDRKRAKRDRLLFESIMVTASLDAIAELLNRDWAVGRNGP